jgi:hypothetical protein
MREYAHKPRYREVPEPGYSVLSGLIYHLSVISSAHSVDNRMAHPVIQMGKSDGPDRRAGARMGALGGPHGRPPQPQDGSTRWRWSAVCGREPPDMPPATWRVVALSRLNRLITAIMRTIAARPFSS